MDFSPSDSLYGHPYTLPSDKDDRKNPSHQLSTSNSNGAALNPASIVPSPSQHGHGQMQSPNTGSRGGSSNPRGADMPVPRSPRATAPNSSSNHTHPGLRTSHNQSAFSGQQPLNSRQLSRVSPPEHWASSQQLKVKVTMLPQEYTTKEVYQKLSRFGYIVKIEMDRMRPRAWVTFQPPPPTQDIYWSQIGGTSMMVERADSTLFTVTSPIDPKKIYYGLNIFHADSIEFGVAIAEHTMNTMRTVEASQAIKMALSLSNHKELILEFPIKIDGKTRQLRFELPLSLLETIYRVDGYTTGKTVLVIPFKSAPKFYMQKEAHLIHETCTSHRRFWLDWFSWYRQTDIVDEKTRKELRKLPGMTNHESPIIDIGRWTCYRLLFDNEVLDGPKYQQFKEALSDYGVSVKPIEEYMTTQDSVPMLWTLLGEEISATHPNLTRPSEQELAFNKLIAGQINLVFDVRYQLEVCLSNRFLKEHTITRKFLERLASMEVHRAIQLLEKVVDEKCEYIDPMKIFSKPLRCCFPQKPPSYCTRLRSAVVTPTMIHANQPVVETSNRIIRKHMADADRFIRVKFSDEKNEGEIYSQEDDRSDAVFERIERIMKNGIVVAGRFYEFLAFGNSQFRERGAFFYAPTASKSADDIRRSMGDFHHIKTAAKFGARLGQCFSTTRAIKSINVRIEEIPDINRNGYCFTDGVGKISALVAQMAAQELGLANPFNDPPSLFQFRLAGCKGVLTIDPKISKHIVHIRPSQYKFEAENVGLEIIRASSLSVACLNRQLIIVLSTLGVPDHIFLEKQQEMVADLEMATREDRVALEKLQRNIDPNQTTLTMAGMIQDGFMKSQEPFMMSLLHLWRSYHMKYLKEKARIMIENGAFLLGCVDETATLRGHEDHYQCRPDASREEKLNNLPEIFVQISDHTKKGQYIVVEGICVLARNPSLHPGDLRIVRAVNRKELHHLRNVVVLPSIGDRDVANMCSGGDLDGDDYIVLWDHGLLPHVINEPPMDFTAEKPVDSSEPITIRDVAEFFVTYMKNDSLRQIAVAHLVHADANSVMDAKCIELARLHSQAVDYNKSGIPARMDPELRPIKYPHYLQRNRPDNKVYKSKSILGRLFDKVQLVDFHPRYENEFDETILQAYQPDSEMLEKAKNIKWSYDSELRRLMAKHDIRTEFEAWSVFVLEHNEETRDYVLAEEFGRTVGLLKERFQRLCYEAVGATQTSDFEAIAPFVAAMYTVTAQEIRAARKQCEEFTIAEGRIVPVRTLTPEQMPLMSFPWLFPSELGMIKTGKHSCQPRLVLHGSLRHHRRRQPVSEVDPTLGNIETSRGTTHVGETLTLFE